MKKLFDVMSGINPLVWIALSAALTLTFGALWLKHWAEQPEIPVNTWVEATPAKPIKKVPKVEVPVKTGKVKVYKEESKAKLKLPEDIFEDKSKQVVDSARVEASDHPHTVISVVDTDDGEVQTYVRKEPLPLLAWDTRGEIGIYAGIKNGEPTARLEAKQGVFQVKALHFGVVGSVDQPLNGGLTGTDYFVGIGAWARW